VYGWHLLGRNALAIWLVVVRPGSAWVNAEKILEQGCDTQFIARNDNYITIFQRILQIEDNFYPLFYGSLPCCRTCLGRTDDRINKGTAPGSWGSDALARGGQPV
jgi:hypothetical protein